MEYVKLWHIPVTHRPSESQSFCWGPRLRSTSHHPKESEYTSRESGSCARDEPGRLNLYQYESLFGMPMKFMESRKYDECLGKTIKSKTVQRSTHRGGGRAPRKLVAVRIQTGHNEEIGIVYLKLFIFLKYYLIIFEMLIRRNCFRNMFQPVVN